MIQRFFFRLITPLVQPGQFSQKYITAVTLLMLCSILCGPAQASETFKSQWKGTYQCVQGRTDVTLDLTINSRGRGSALFSFGGSSRNSGQFSQTLKFAPTTRALLLEPERWIKRPQGFRMVGVAGTFSPDLRGFEGKVKFTGCSGISLRHVSGVLPSKAAATAPKPDVTKPAAAPLSASAQARLDKKNRQQRMDLSGQWFGITACQGRNLTPIEMTVSALGNRRYLSVTRVDMRSQTLLSRDEIRPHTHKNSVDPFRFVDPQTGKASVGSLRPLDIDEIVSVGADHYMEMSMSGVCDDGVLARFVPIAGFGGAYAKWETLPERCAGLTDWMGDVQKASTAKRALMSQQGGLSDQKQVMPTLRQQMFLTPVFERRFGRKIGAVEAGQYARLVRQVAECMVYSPTSEADRIKARAEADWLKETRVRDLRAWLFPKGRSVSEAEFVETRVSLEELQTAERALARHSQEARRFLNDLELVAQLSDLNAQAKSHMPAMMHWSLAEVEAGLEAISARRLALVRNFVVAELDQPADQPAVQPAPTALPQTDMLAGHVLLGADLGHYIYVAQEDISREGCRNGLRTQVRLRSPLFMHVLEQPGYLRMYWQDAARGVMRHCRSNGLGRGAIIFNATLLLEGQSLGVARFTQREAFGPVAASDISLEAAVRARTSGAGVVYDKIAERFLTNDFAPLNTQDIGNLSALAEEGDVDALAALAFEGDAPGTVSLRRDNSYDVGQIRVDMDAALRATEAGSIVGAFLLARATMTENGFGVPGYATQRAGWRDQSDATKARFLDAAGRAHVGGHFGVSVENSLIGQISEHWGINLAPGIALARREGLIRPMVRDLDALDADGALGAFSVADTRAAVWDYYPRVMCRRSSLLFDGLTRNNPGLLGTLSLLQGFRATPRGAACEMDSGAGITLTLTPSRVTDLECDGTQTAQLCTFRFELRCRWEANDVSPAAMAHNRLLYNPLCSALSSPRPVQATFGKDASDGEWRVVGALDFLGD